ncbi:MAG: class I SAM-dependent methyltransferase [Phycisphaerales bacterium]
MHETAGEYWRAYFEAIADHPPRETLLHALALFDREGRRAPEPTPGAAPVPGVSVGAHIPGSCPCHPAAAGVALDLACGEGRDTLELLRRRWCVLAIDSHPEALARLSRVVPEDLSAYLRTGVETMEDLPLPPDMFDLVNASMALPHCPAASFPGLWERLGASIRPGGRFAGQLFGPRDTWASSPDPGVSRIFHSRGEVESLLARANLEAEMFDEVERDGRDAFGRAKRWHVYHLVARKKA